MSAVLLVIVIMMPGQATPIFYVEPMASYEECAAEQNRFVAAAGERENPRGVQLQIGCTMTFAPSEKH